MTFDAGSALVNGPSRRKKKYVLFLSESKVGTDRDVRTVEKAVESAIPEYTLIRSQDIDDAMKQLNYKNIELIIIDYSFQKQDDLNVDFAVEAKKRKKCPIFFVTRDDQQLILNYRKKLYLYEELDDYFLSPVDYVDVSRKLKRATAGAGRAARRFPFNQAVNLFRLNQGDRVEATLTDLSLVGYGLRLQNPGDLSRNDQIQIAMPLTGLGMFHPELGEVLKISSRVRRVSINGSSIGCSTEHLTLLQNEVINNILKMLARKRAIEVAKTAPPPVKEMAAPKKY